MGKRYVRHALVRFTGEDGGRKYGYQNQEVDLPAGEEARLDRLDALHPEGYNPSAGTVVDADGESTVERPDLDTAPAEDVAAWIKGAKVNASEVVAAAEGDVDRAMVLLAGEKLAQGDDGRKTVVEPLQKIIDEGGAS